jgi:hypothetical protein
MTPETKIQDGQRFALVKLIGGFTQRRDCRLWILSKLLSKTVESSKDLTIQDWRKIRDEAYPNWTNNEWETGEEFKKKISGLCGQFEEQVLGQKKLF